MDIIESIKKRLKQNEDIAKKFHEIEISILSILNFRDLCESLLTEISKNFEIPFVWLSIIENTPVSEHIKSINDSDILKSRTCFILKNSFKHITQLTYLTPILANSDMKRFIPLYPALLSTNLGSLAIVPIVLDGKLIGSLNLGDNNHDRFEPGIDTSLLDQLSVKISLCFSNVFAHEKLKYLAFHDPLTGLVNRGVMDRILIRECERATRYNADLCLIFFDLDDFKIINDTYGHDKGDQALILVAKLLEGLKRGSDIIARYAGDEFVAILPSTNAEQAEKFVSRIKDELLQRAVKVDNNKFHVCLSYGIASFFEDNIKTAEKLIKHADIKLYKAKQFKNNKP